MKRGLLLLTALLIAGLNLAMAQHTIGLSAGSGMATARLYPSEWSYPIWGSNTAGFSWRYYGQQQVLGCVGVDIEYMQRGYCYVPYASSYDDKADFLRYTRTINSIMVPIIWQPHVYMFNHRIRLFLDAAATFSYNMNSHYVNEFAEARGWDNWEGKYTYKLARDNRWGYGLMGGVGIAVLVKRYEIFARARYYFGYSDILRNRNKYSDNYVDDPAENPFGYTPVRSPMDNITISMGVNYRLSKGDFINWKQKRTKRGSELNEGFNYVR
ncbi:MAG: outer membrane beta-barrel protein [Rikenellaceae bacterium]